MQTPRRTTTLAAHALLPTLTAILAAAACSSSEGPTETPASTGETDVPKACGTLDATAAASIVVNRIDTAFRATFRALGAVDTSIILARALSLGDEKKLTPSADGLKWLDEEELPTLRDRVFVNENVESEEGSQVVFLLRPDVMCRNSTGDAGADAEAGAWTAQSNDTRSVEECLERYTKTPQRVAVSRVACETEGSVHVAVLIGDERKEYMNIDLIGSKVVARLDVGEFAANTTVQRGGDAGAEPMFDEGATGRLEIVEDLLAADKVHASLRITKDIALDVSEKQDGGASSHGSVRVAAATGDAIDVTADGSARTLECSLALGPVRLTIPFSSFVEMFNRKAAPQASPAEVVDVTLPVVKGKFSFDGTGDELRATDLGIGDTATNVLHGSDTILSWEVNPAQQHKVDFRATGATNGSLAASVPSGFDLHIHYALAPVQALVTEPWQFSLDDDVRFALSGSGTPSVLLLQGNGDRLSLLDDQEGSLFQVQSGTFEATSRIAPDESVSVAAGACLNRHTSDGHHELLQHLSGGTCEPPSTK